MSEFDVMSVVFTDWIEIKAVISHSEWRRHNSSTKHEGSNCLYLKSKQLLPFGFERRHYSRPAPNPSNLTGPRL